MRVLEHSLFRVQHVPLSKIIVCCVAEPVVKFVCTITKPEVVTIIQIKNLFFHFLLYLGFFFMAYRAVSYGTTNNKTCSDVGP